MRFPRPRFSLRRLLIGVAIATVVFYALLVRPTVVANRFAQAMEARDLSHAASMLKEGDEKSFELPYSQLSDTDSVAQISSLNWSDLWHCRRTISVQTSVSAREPMRSEGGLPVYQQTAIYHAGPLRVRLVQKEGLHIW